MNKNSIRDFLYYDFINSFAKYESRYVPSSYIARMDASMRCMKKTEIALMMISLCSCHAEGNKGRDKEGDRERQREN